MAKKIAAFDTPDLSKSVSPKLLGEAIKAKRTQSHLRLEDAAALCGVAKQTLLNVEHGQENTQFGTILKICNSLGVALKIQPWQKLQEIDDEWQ